jgi:hypothetical protein
MTPSIRRNGQEQKQRANQQRTTNADEQPSPTGHVHLLSRTRSANPVNTRLVSVLAGYDWAKR